MSSHVQHPTYLKKLFAPLEKKAQKNGLQAIKFFLKKKNIIPHQVDLPLSTLKTLQTKPCILIINHPHYIEFLLALTQLPKRQDIFLLITDSCLGLIPSLDKNLIPVHIQHHGPDNLPPKKIDFGRLFFFTPAQKTIKEAHDYNRKSIDLAAKKVNDGGILLVCPQGLRTQKGRWFNGIGFIVSKIKKNQDICLINVYIKGTSSWDILRTLPFLHKFLPKLKIRFSLPFSAQKYLGKNPKQITKILEKKYNDWSSVF
jgi:hypothetical protein